MLMERLSTWIRARFVRVEVREEKPAPAAAVAVAVARPVVAVAPVAPAPVAAMAAVPEFSAPDRPHSAVSILRNEPNLQAAELAARAGVTVSYARSLIRRQQAKPLTAAFRPKASEGSVAQLQGQVRELARRVEHNEDRMVQPAAVASRRVQVLERNTAGVATTAISEQLAMPLGEVDFILKMDRLKKASKIQQNVR